MLTRKQLEDMSNNSVSWNLKDAAQTALALADMVRRLVERNGSRRCLICGSRLENGVFVGHKPDCELAALLEELEVEEG